MSTLNKTGITPEDLGLDNEFMPDGEISTKQDQAPKRKIKSDQSEAPDQVGSTVRVMRDDGKYQRRIPIELQGLSSEMLPPLTKKKIAEYEVIGRGTIDPLTKELSDPVQLILPGKYVIYDPFDKDVLRRHKTLKNVTRFENVIRNGVNVAEEVVADIEFENSIKKVAIERDYLMYCLLELHPLNESNPHRDKGQAAAFRRLDIANSRWQGSQNAMDLAFEAESQVVNMKDANTLIQWAHAAGIPTHGRTMDTGEGSVKYDLRRFARSNPKDFFALDPRNDMAVKIAVLDAVELGLVEYTPDNRVWRFCGSGDYICVLLPQDEPSEGLVKMLRKKEYSEKYEQLQKLLNYWS